MHFEFEHLGSTTPFELPEGQHLLGGDAEDHVRLDGLPAHLLTLRIEGPRLMVEARQVFSVAGVLVPPGVPRLVHPDEVVGLTEGMSLRTVNPMGGREREVGTVAVLKHLLMELEEPLASRAATLLCLTGEDVGRTFALAEACTELGRGHEVAARLRDLAVSRRHARVLHHEEAFLLEDLDSPNGVYLNGQRLSAPTALKEGDVLELGRTLLRFQAPVAEPPAEPPPPPGETESPAPAEATSEPETSLEPPPEPPTPSRARGRTEGWLLWMGAALALMGLLAAFSLTP